MTLTNVTRVAPEATMSQKDVVGGMRAFRVRRRQRGRANDAQMGLTNCGPPV